MNRYLFVCIVSASIHLSGSVGEAVGQELRREGTIPPRPIRSPAFRERTATSPTPFRYDGTLEPDELADAELFTPEEQRNIAVYERTNRSVVNIMTRTVRPDFMFNIEVAEGSGSGSILDKRGHILTNLHVIEGAREIRVTLHTGTVYEASFVGEDPLNDVAVLKIDAPEQDLFPVTLGDASGLRVGQRIYALGNPFGLERTLTTGIISSLNRTLPSRNERKMKSIIQIDAALNRGNSGGPLLNSRGQLIGMNTAIASTTGENTGVGFAIPVSTIRRVVPQLIQTGRVVRPDSGIVAVQTDRGLVIGRLTPGGPGERAGLQGFRLIREQMQRGPYLYERTRIDQSNADIILAVDGRPVESRDDLHTEIERKKPGEEVTLTISRGGQTRKVTIRLEPTR
jgi:S1-C subfamily serine protease